MYRRLGRETLKTGEVMEVGCVEPPAEQWRERVENSLIHKPDIWRYHIKKAVRGQTDDLQNYFYVGHLDRDIITGVMTVEHNRVGILGHVYTHPEHRRKGACSRLMKHQMDDFRSRGGGVLLLGTGYRTPPFRIYESFGFEGIMGKSGCMRYATEEDFEEKYYAPGDVSVREVRWEDWPAANLLTCQPGADVLRTVAFGVPYAGVGRFSSEEAFLYLMQGREQDSRRRAWSAESASGSLVGIAMLTPDLRFAGGVHLLDLIVHENFWEQAGTILEQIEWPEAKVQCYTDLGCPAKVEALEAAGFTQEALLAKQLAWAGGLLDVAIFTRNP